MKAIAIIVAAGSGRRAGGIAKQFEPVLGRRVIEWSAATFASHPRIDQLIIVGPDDAVDDLAALPLSKLVVTAGGRTRTESVKNGLAVAKGADADKVLIHDAARPGLTAETIDQLLEALEGADAAAPALPVTDALKRQSGTALETLHRDDLYRVQTPQAFRVHAIRSALDSAQDLVDDLAAIEAQGGKVALVPGTEELRKITYPEDFAIAEKLLSAPLGAPRMGTGFDVHTFGPGTFITLCGLEIPHSHGLVGHSDADVAWHALTDAILGAVALGDIGDHFPPSDPKWEGAPSKLFLAHAIELTQAEGYALGNVDITVICEAPKIKPHREAMRQATAELTGLPLNAVSLKATTTEGLGFTGRREGIAAQAAAVLTPIAKNG